MDVLRQRPELAFLPLAAIFVVVNVGPWGYGPTYVSNFFVYLTFQASNQIFPLTWSLSWGLFLGTLWMFLRYRLIAAWRAFLIAGTLPFLGVGIFEVPYDLGVWHFHPENGVTPFIVLSIGLWFALGFTSAGWWRLTRAYYLLLTAFALGYLAWAGLGMPLVYGTTPAMEDLGYAFNVPLKIGAFVLAGLPVLQGARRAHTEFRPAPTADAGAPRQSHSG